MGEPSGRFRFNVIVIVPRPSRATSAPVKTASTPGALSAAAASIPRMRACAYIERTITVWAWPGRSTSAWKRPSPRTRRTSSKRLMPCPIPNWPMPPWSGRRREHGNRRPALARLEDHPHGLADPHRVEIAVDDVGHHRRAFLERDVGDRVGLGHASHDAVRVDPPAARRGTPLGGVAAAERTDGARVVVSLTARRALLDDETALGRRIPERLRLRRDHRRGDLAVGLGHDGDL